MSWQQYLIDESNSDYHARGEISASRLKSMARGWRWYEAEHITRTIERKESPAMRMGTAIHASILEPEAFGRQYVVCPADCADRRTKKHKEWAGSLPPDVIVLDSQEHRSVISCRNAVYDDRAASMILANASHFERSFLYDDADAGAHCRVRFDAVSGGVVCDLKTISSLDDGEVERAIQNYRYDLQAAHYLAGFQTIGAPVSAFVFIFVETSPPHRCRVVRLSDGDLDAAFESRLSLLREYARRSESGDWSDPGEGELQTVFLPEWFNRKVMASL